MGNFLRLFGLLALGLAASSTFAGEAEIQVADPWVQAAPPSAKVLAAYLEIKNNGEKPQTLAEITSPVFGQVEIHRTTTRGNIARMEHLKELVIPPRSSVAIKPGGMHLMLMGGKNPLRAGDQVPMTLIFKNGEKIAISAAVRSMQEEDAGNSQHADHSKHQHH
ncbi:MAG: hypothetical protein FD134_1613 [Gallionellaceae bacterium]|nr:MAG: hypothetical protein FD134_1613 [Gallionellaceae bacterium]